jgi:hypothetical protein
MFSISAKGQKEMFCHDEPRERLGNVSFEPSEVSGRGCLPEDGEDHSETHLGELLNEVWLFVVLFK